MRARLHRCRTAAACRSRGPGAHPERLPRPDPRRSRTASPTPARSRAPRPRHGLARHRQVAGEDLLASDGFHLSSCAMLPWTSPTCNGVPSRDEAPSRSAARPTRRRPSSTGRRAGPAAVTSATGQRHRESAVASSARKHESRTRPPTLASCATGSRVTTACREESTGSRRTGAARELSGSPMRRRRATSTHPSFRTSTAVTPDASATYSAM
jgi:hypothetical protein